MMKDQTANNGEWYAEGLRFTCTMCGNCCSGPPGVVWYSPEEEVAMARRLKLDVPAFRKRYAREIDGDWSLSERLTKHGYDCIFLVRDKEGKGSCGIYEDRPTQCRTWPFWPGNLKSPRGWKQAGARCPGMTDGNTGQGRLYSIEEIRIIRDRQAAALP